MFGFLSFLGLLGLGFFIGGWNERRHFRRIEKAEAELAHIRVVNLKRVPEGLQPGGVLVTGNVVVAIDYFKKIMAGLRKIFGGELKSYQSLLLRARREAIVRMKREADEYGADMIYNVRLEFSAVGAQPQVTGGAELLAYGTAVKNQAQQFVVP